MTDIVVVEENNIVEVIRNAGQDGAPGEGVAAGGEEGDVLRKKSATDYDTEWGPENPDGIDTTKALAMRL